MAVPPTTTASKKIISTNNNKISSNSHEKVFRNIYRKRPVLKSLFNKVSGLQPAALLKKRLQHKCFPVKLSRTRFFIEHFRTTASGKAVPIAISNDISKAYYQKGFVICFLRSTYGRFVEFLIETYNKGFSYS